MDRRSFLTTLAAASILPSVRGAELPEGVARVDLLGYPGCIQLRNRHTVATLCHHAGGRVLEYAHLGQNALYLDSKEAAFGSPDGPKKPASAGRFDIGPEYIIPKHENLWTGPWTVEATGPRSARLTSVKDEATGVQLVRDFALDAETTKLSCTQTIRNISNRPVNWAHWSRTFAVHGGIGVIPQTPAKRRFPNGFVMYEQTGEHAIILKPTDPNVRMRGDFLEVLGPTRLPKLGFDSHAGWFAYVMPHGQAFVKRFAAPVDAAYPEIAGLTLCFWYPKAEFIPACELEPHGPRKEIPPGGSSAFTEDWYLLPHPYPKAGDSLDLDALQRSVNTLR
jgi:hypothetical protein